MPTFEDPKADADELRQAARGLAYATRNIDVPADSYEVLGSVQHALIGLHQSLQQLASWHLRYGQYAATDQGDRAAGHAHAVETAAQLTAAAMDVDRATDRVMAAWAENGHIAWQPDRHIEAAPNQLTALAHALSARESALTADTAATSESPKPGRDLSR